MTYWPEATFPAALSHSLGSARRTNPEQILAQTWPSAHPVILSSGRAALVWALRLAGLTRPATVSLFPFASHCVIDAVGRIATPESASENSAATVHYHQWGYPRAVLNGGGELIEDSVDSLYVPGAQLLTEGGRFEIWSLSKILGTIGGGVLWCKDPKDAEVVRGCVQTSRTHASLRWFLKAMTLNGKAKMADVWWSAGETATDGAPSRLLLSETASRLQSWQQLVEQRVRRVTQVVDANVALLEAPNLRSRIPCLLPVVAEEDQVSRLNFLGLPQSRRHFLDWRGRLVLTYPLPIHQGISDKTLRTALQVLRN